MATTMRFGANYTPRRGWFHSQAHLDLSHTREDLAHIASLGLDHVRIFPLWPHLQPSRGLIDSHAVDTVLNIVDAAGEAGLDVSVDVLNGHLSSFDFLPSWVTTWHQRNIFTDPEVIAAEQELTRTLGVQLEERPHCTGLTLGNEIGQFAAPRHPSQQVTSVEEAGAWTRSLLETATEAFPRGRHTHCFDDDLWFVDAQPFTPEHAVTLGVETTVHSWVFGGAGQRYGIDNPALAFFARYLIEIADMWHRALEVSPERGIWLQEIGAPTPWVTPEAAPDFAVNSVRAAISHPKVTTVTWWCSHDVSRDLPDYPEVEYTLGLIDTHGQTKPIGQALSELIAEVKRDGVPAQSSVDPLDAPDLALDGSDRSRTNTRSDLFDTWIQEAREGRLRPLNLPGK